RIRVFLIGDCAAEAASLVEQEYRCSMIHRIFAILARNLLGVDMVGLDYIGDILRRASDADNAVGNIADIGLHDLLRVTLRVDGDEISLDIPGFRSKLLQPAIQLIERGGADIRAVSEPEEDSRRRGAQVVLCERLSVHGDKVERTAKRFFRRLLV